MSAFHPVYTFFSRTVRFSHPQTGPWSVVQFVQRKRYPIGRNQPTKFDEEKVIFAAPFTQEQVNEIRSKTYNLCQDFYLEASCLPEYGIDGYAWIIINQCTKTLRGE